MDSVPTVWSLRIKGCLILCWSFNARAGILTIHLIDILHVILVIALLLSELSWNSCKPQLTDKADYEWMCFIHVHWQLQILTLLTNSFPTHRHLYNSIRSCSSLAPVFISQQILNLFLFSCVVTGGPAVTVKQFIVFWGWTEQEVKREVEWVYSKWLCCSTSEVRVFSSAELKVATRSFRSDTILSKGGFGSLQRLPWWQGVFPWQKNYSNCHKKFEPKEHARI